MRQNDLSKTNTLFMGRDVSIIFLGKIAGQLLTIIITLVFTRMLGVEQYGVYALFLTVCQLVSLPTNLGMSQGIIPYIPKLKSQKKNNSTPQAFILITVFIIVASTLLSVLVYTQKHRILISHPSLIRALTERPYLLCLIAALSLFGLSQGYLQGAQEFKQYTLQQHVIEPLLRVLFFLFAFKASSSGAASLIVALSLSYLTSFLWAQSLTIKESFLVSVDVWKEAWSSFSGLIRFSLPLFFSSIAELSVKSSDLLMLIYFTGVESAALYLVASKVGMLSNIFLQSSNTSFEPKASELFHRGEIEGLEKLYQSSTYYVLFLSMLPFLLLVVHHNDVMNLFSSDFRRGGWTLLWIALGQLCNASTGGSGRLLNATGRGRIQLVLNSGAAVFNILLNFLLIPRYGASGAAFASMLSVSGINFVRLYLIHRLMKLSPYHFRYIKILLAGIIATLPIFLFKSIWCGAWYSNIAVYAPLQVFLYLAVYASTGLTHIEKEKLYKSLSKLR